MRPKYVAVLNQKYQNGELYNDTVNPIKMITLFLY
jgi:hypothetical protein